MEKELDQIAIKAYTAVQEAFHWQDGYTDAYNDVRKLIQQAYDMGFRDAPSVGQINATKTT